MEHGDGGLAPVKRRVWSSVDCRRRREICHERDYEASHYSGITVLAGIASSSYR